MSVRAPTMAAPMRAGRKLMQIRVFISLRRRLLCAVQNALTHRNLKRARHGNVISLAYAVLVLYKGVARGLACEDVKT